MRSKVKAEQWLENSKKTLLSNGKKTNLEVQSLTLEINKRQEIFDHFSMETLHSLPNMENIEGVYHIIGLNQTDNQSCYTGFLSLQITGNHRVYAEWIINGEQLQSGSGFFHQDTLIINFFYKGENEYSEKKFKGVVAYTFINNTMLTGFWSEKHGDDNFIGLEEGRKVENEELLNTHINLN